MGGDFPATVRAMAHVLVIVGEVFRHQFQAVGAAAGHSGGLVCVHGGSGSSSAERPLTGSIVGLDAHVLGYQAHLVQYVVWTWPWSWTLSGSVLHFPECLVPHLVQWLR